MPRNIASTFGGAKGASHPSKSLSSPLWLYLGRPWAYIVVEVLAITLLW
jgi:hypothetical protein